MSYTRTYHHSVPVHGSRTVSYPASENGGTITVEFSDVVETDINIHVDTAPFDSSINRTNRSADKLTLAVTGMEAAQIASLRTSARQVSDSMINGFYNLTMKDITEQKSEERAKLQSRFGLLMETAKALNEKKIRMEEDIARIQRHYSVVFQNMDQDLEKRILELDRPAFQLANGTRSAILLEPCRQETGFSVEQSNSTGKTGNLLTIARLRSKISGILDSLSDYVMKCDDYKADVANTLEAVPVGKPEAEYIPVVFCERRSVVNPNSGEWQTCLPEEMAGKEGLRENLQRQAFTGLQNAWRPCSQEELAQIDQAFRKCVEEASMSDNPGDPNRSRVYQEMMKLWQNNRNNIMSL